MKTKQLIALQRNKVYTSLESPAEFNATRRQKLITLTEELKMFGHYLSAETLMYLSDSDMESIFNEVLPELAKKYYPGKFWNPLYPGFPQQVIEKSLDELWEDQHKIYDTLDYDAFLKDNMWYLNEEVSDTESPIILERMTEEGLLQIFDNIVSSGNSLAPDTREELDWFLSNYPKHELPENIPFKETLCVVMAARPEYEAKGINDLLRYGLYSLGASPELPNVPRTIVSSAWRRGKVDNPMWRKLRSMKRSDRRKLMERFESFFLREEVSMANSIIDAKRFYGHWVLLSERLHPG